MSRKEIKRNRPNRFTYNVFFLFAFVGIEAGTKLNEIKLISRLTNHKLFYAGTQENRAYNTMLFIRFELHCF